MNDKTMLESLGATSMEDALRIKQQEKQIRMFSIRKPQPVPMTEDECRALCDTIGLKYAPGYEQRVMAYIISNEMKDRYGDIVRAAGCKVENYMKNPVMFFSHNYSTPPIGNSLKVWPDLAEKNVQAWGLFVSTEVDTTGFSDLIFRFVISGFMRACSVGFQPEKSFRPETEAAREAVGLGKYGVEYLIWDMLEWSPCGVPANPQALQNSLKDMSGKLTLEKEHIEAAEKFHIFSDVNMLDMLVEGLKPAKAFVCPGPDAWPLPACSLDGIQSSLEEKDLPEDIALHPYPNEHACRLNDPKKYDKIRRGKRKSDGKEYSVLFGHVDGGDTWEEQAYRYSKDVWEAKDARKHCKDHGGSFSAAVEKPEEERIYLSCEDGACEPIVPKQEEPTPPIPEEGEENEPQEAPAEIREEVYIAKIGDLWDGTKVCLVDGEDVREYISAGFMSGGHGYADDTSFIPKDEIWIEEIECSEEMQMVLVHKIVEYILMKYLTIEDMQAHMQTLTVEYLIRKIGNWEGEENEEKEGGEKPVEPESEKLFTTPLFTGLYDNPALIPVQVPRLFSKPKL